MMRRPALALGAAISGSVAALACSTVLEAGPSAPDDGGVVFDARAGDSGRVCVWDAPFEDVPLTIDVNLGDVGSPRLSADENTLAFDHAPPPERIPQVRIATRVAPRMYKSDAVDLGLGPGVRVARPTISGDGQILFVDVQKQGAAEKEIYGSVRKGPTGAFEPAAPVAAVNMASDESHPFLTLDERELYFVRGPALLVFDRKTEVVGGVVTVPADHSAPVVSGDRNTIYLKGPLTNIVMAHRNSTAVGFDPPVPIRGKVAAQINKGIPGWLSPDNCRLYYSEDGLLRVASR